MNYDFQTARRIAQGMKERGLSWTVIFFYKHLHIMTFFTYASSSDLSMSLMKAKVGGTESTRCSA